MAGESDDDDLLFGAASLPLEAFGAYSSAEEIQLVVANTTFCFQQQISTENRKEPSVLLWNAAVSLANAWARGALVQPCGLRVLDIGAGLGICALAAAALGATKVVATELPGVALDALQQSILQNVERSGLKVPIEVFGLKWGLGQEGYLTSIAWDLVLCSDLIYSPELQRPLLRSLRHVVIPGHTKVLVAFERRGLEDDFFSAAHEQVGLEPLTITSAADDALGVEFHLLATPTGGLGGTAQA